MVIPLYFRQMALMPVEKIGGFQLYGEKEEKFLWSVFFQLQSVVQSGVTNVFIFLFVQLIEKQN